MKSFVKKSTVQKIIAAALVMAVGLQLGSVDAQAASKNWNLRYIKYAPTSEYKTSWSTSVTTTTTTTKMTINEVGGGAQIWVYTSNGIGALFEGSGSVKVTKRKKGQRVYTQVKYSRMGSNTNYPSGKLTY